MSLWKILSFIFVACVVRHVDATNAERAAALRALEWLVKEWDEDIGWGTNTPRGLVAHEYARRSFPVNSSLTSVAKTLNVLTAVDLLKEFYTSNITASDVAHFVNALTATCQNPRNFHGRDIVAELRGRANEDKDAKGTMSPLIHLTLCINGRSVPADVHRVYRAANGKEPGMLALGAMALMCLVPRSTKNITNGWEESLSDFVNKSWNHLRSYHPPDIYATSMVLQMTNCVSRHLQSVKVERYVIDSLHKTLLEKQFSNGSFGDFLSTYLAIPALLGFCPLDMKRICDGKLSSLREYEVEYTPLNHLINVTYALWINRGIEDPKWLVRSRAYAVHSNWTLLDLMNHAKSQSSLFDFSYNDDSQGKFVYSIGGIPNDSVRGFHWKLLVNTVSDVYNSREVYSVQDFQPALDSVKLTNGYSYIFLFSRRT